MPKWIHKTEEEKKALLVKLAEHNKPKAVRQQEENDKQMDAILDAKEIPIKCTNCYKWTGSDRYEIADLPSPMSQMLNKMPPDLIPFILGTCRHCRTPVKRVMLISPEDYIIIGILVISLHGEGRLTDRRKSK